VFINPSNSFFKDQDISRMCCLIDHPHPRSPAFAMLGQEEIKLPELKHRQFLPKRLFSFIILNDVID
jgi:hypothetical protein